jgi:hypothetical protein
MPGQATPCMPSNLRIVVDFQQLLEARGNPFVTRLVPGECDDCAPAHAKARILSYHAQEVRHGIEVPTCPFLASVASEGVGRPLADLRMLVVEALEYEAPGFGIRLMIEEAEAVASGAPVTAAKARPDDGKGCLPEADEPSQ